MSALPARLLRRLLRPLRAAACALLMAPPLAAAASPPKVEPASAGSSESRGDPALPQEIVTAQGIRVWLKSEPSLPAVALNVQFVGGGMVDAPERPGAAFLIGGLLEEGAGDLDAKAFQEARDELGARIVYMT